MRMQRRHDSSAVCMSVLGKPREPAEWQHVHRDVVLAASARKHRGQQSCDAWPLIGTALCRLHSVCGAAPAQQSSAAGDQ
jgi:hypothetical protein